MSEEQQRTPTKTPERRILGELGNSNPDSPTANLRLLTALATSLNSPYKESSSSSGIDRADEESTVQQVLDDPPPAQQQDSGCTKLLPRKEKSLTLLCNKFLNLFPLVVQENVKKEISLNTTVKALGTEKRRIYDIINVLESLEMASKAGKNLYHWHGQSRLPLTLAKLKMSAIELGLEKQIQEIQKVRRAYIEASCHSCNSSPAKSMVPQSPVVNNTSPDNSVKEDKSLGLMCKKFVMLFLVSLKNGVINLDIAAQVLFNEADSVDATKTPCPPKCKTKVRRLYDIANVLLAIGLIEKVDMYNCFLRKPIFKYTGPTVDCINYDIETQPLVGMTTPSKRNPRSSGTRHSSRIAGRLFSSTPSGNKREPKKKKLFGSDSKLERTYSSPCFNSTRGNGPSIKYQDDPLFRVVEMEYKRMKFSENKPKVCTTLFPRHSSDSCISPTKIEDSPQKAKDSNVVETTPAVSNESSNLITILPMVRNDNLVSEPQSSNISDINVTPIGTVRINVPLELKITPIALQQKTPKFVKLSKLDLKKLVPVSHEDIKIKLASMKPVAVTATTTSTTTRPNVPILTRIPTKDISPGEIYACQAIKVGDTVQFVPIKNNSSNSD
ncbi:transcription factor E2F7-like [Copidosoma floridanum]|uniref:transcription factor E2F7-like n=1 Tax=Copidosoma floridanum TaxID=29053 RepID=UPI0006C96419|nr:transcription factor E2F7-like [Copidosoma floridanum]